MPSTRCPRVEPVASGEDKDGGELYCDRERDHQGPHHDDSDGIWWWADDEAGGLPPTP